jgi:hypothetical protein
MRDTLDGVTADYHGIKMSTVASSSGESRLAWSLAEMAARLLDEDQRDELFVAIGVGDTFDAICSALDAISRAHCGVEGSTAIRLKAWLTAYRGHDDEAQLRRWVHRVTR